MFYRIIITALLLPLSAYAAPKTHEYQLDNGLKIIVREDHRAPIVTAQIWYKVGSSYEPGGITGISHVVEHMMFKGTPKHPDGEFSHLVAHQGGQLNAFTSYDYTGYYEQFAVEHLPLSFELESDRMKNAILDKDSFLREIQVVMEERRLRFEDNPQALTYEQFAATAFVNSGYHHMPIGWMNDLENLTVEDVRSWYDAWYTPNNAVVIVVGAVKPDDVYELALKHYGSIQASTLPIVKPRTEIAQTGERRITMKKPAQLPFLMMGYHVPVIKTAQEDWEPYALAVLATALGGANSARLQTTVLRQQEMVVDISADYDGSSRYQNLFKISAIPAQNISQKQVEKAIVDQITLLQNELITRKEMDRVIAQMTASEMYARDSIDHQAYLLGSLASVDLPWKLADEYLEKIKTITPEQVRTVTQRYLNPDQLTVAFLDPQPINKQ